VQKCAEVQKAQKAQKSAEVQKAQKCRRRTAEGGRKSAARINEGAKSAKERRKAQKSTEETLPVGCLALCFRVSRRPLLGRLAREFLDAPCGLSGSAIFVLRDAPGWAVWHVGFETLPVGCLAQDLKGYLLKAVGGSLYGRTAKMLEAKLPQGCSKQSGRKDARSKAAVGERRKAAKCSRQSCRF
jgi:hypothetical protein